MLWVLCSGAPWRDLPERYGKWKTVYERLRRYRMEGFLDVLLQRLQVKLNEQGLIDFHLWQVDSIIRAHVEQSIGWIKECRRIATRYEKLAVSFLPMIKLAFIQYYIKRYSPDTA